MSLDEEIAIYQFAQGVYPDAALLDRFSLLEGEAKTARFMDVNVMVRQAKPTDSDMKQAMTSSALTHADVSAVFPHDGQWKIAIHKLMNLSEVDMDKVYALLLHLFKATYQRRSTMGGPDNWHYWDLSNRDVVQNIRTRHQEILEEVYANPSFRSEFTSIARLWHENDELHRTRMQAPESEPKMQYHFVSYDEMVTEWVVNTHNKRVQAILVLRQAVMKALSKQYNLVDEQTSRIVLEVIGRYVREIYYTDLLGFQGIPR